MSIGDEMPGPLGLHALGAFHPASLLGRLRHHRAEHQAQHALDRLPPHLREDLGLDPGACCTDPGLLEVAARMAAGRW